MRKKVDSKIQTLIENIIAMNQRGFFLIVGDRGRDQVVNLHYLLMKHLNKSKPKVLWCYKKELGFSSHYQKRMKDIKKQQQNGNYDNDMENPFELFISSNEIRYCYYKETQKILGNTFNLLILQDFESITPNTLCRTIETVQGGGLIILLIKTMTSLKQLYTMAMDVHQRYRLYKNIQRTEQFQDVVPRFNERFLLSLSNCQNSIVIDDELNILPISSLINDIVQIKPQKNQNQQLIELQDSMQQNSLVGPLIKLAKTLDQAKAVMMFIEAIVEKNFRCTISLTAARGRGKSAAIGLSVAAAIQCGFSNIFVSAPSPENLKTFFEFVLNGLEALGYKENMHYDILQSTHQDYNNCVIRVNVYKTHRQFIQFVFPKDGQKLSQADLLIIDEAASIPVNFIKELMGPYAVFLSSTINGYEGTGRSLSLKLISQLRDQNKIMNNQNQNKSGIGARLLKEITLQDPIRYSTGDPIENWLNQLLLLEATQAVQLKSGLPHPDKCELHLVNRDTLFSYHKASEQFLFNMMSLFISSHYKNSPNDLQLLSDAPGHSVFVLMEKINDQSQKNFIPDILCIIQIALEGNISNSKNQVGQRPAGDLIPWVMQEQFQDDNFPKLKGARIVRIAVHPQAQKMGYGSKALEILNKFFEGELIDLSNDQIQLEEFDNQQSNKINIESNLQVEVLKPKKNIKPLLKKLSQIRPPQLNYLGTSFGLTPELFKFWRKNNFYPTYIRQTLNDITAEHSCIMLKTLKQNEEDDNSWLNKFSEDFKKRFLSLFSFEFKSISLQMSLSLLNPNLTTTESDDQNIMQKEEWLNNVSLYDLKRLEAYTKNLVDYHLILDLVPILSRIFFLKRFKSSIRLSYSQAAILLGLGLQHKNIDTVSEELNIPVSQSLALFNKAIKKFTNEIKQIFIEEIEENLLNVKEIEMNPLKDQTQQIIQEGQKAIKKLQGPKSHKYNFELDDVNEINLNQKGSSLLAKRQKQQDYQEPIKKVKKNK